MKKNRIKAFGRIIALSFLFGISAWIAGNIFGNLITKYHESNNHQKIKHVIFDLGGVLFEGSKFEAFKNHIGIIKILKYVLIGQNPLLIDKKFIGELHTLTPLKPGRPNALTPDGHDPLPELFHQWLSGEKEPKKIMCEINQFFNDKQCNKSMRKSELELLKTVAQITFTPKILASIMKPVREGIEFVKKCKEHGYEVYILSNLDLETYELLYKKYPELFNLFKRENIFISGDLGIIKPDTEIYNVVINKDLLDPNRKNLNPQECIFIDDQKENIEKAAKLGINVIWCRKKKILFGQSKPNFEKVSSEFDKLVAAKETLTNVKTVQTAQA